MTQQQQTHQSWPDKTIKQAITNNQKTIHLQFMPTLGYPDNTKYDLKIFNTQFDFFIEDEICETDNMGRFDFAVDSHFVQTTLACNEKTTLSEVAQKAAQYIFAHKLKWNGSFARSVGGKDNCTITPFQGEYRIEFFVNEKKSLLSKKTIEYLAGIAFVVKIDDIIKVKDIFWLAEFIPKKVN